MPDPIPTLDDLDLDGATALIRSDLNVPLAHGAVADDFRVLTSMRTISDVHAAADRVVVMSHLGRPEGPDESLSLAPVAERLGELSGFDVVMAPAVVGSDVKAAIEDAPPDSVVMLENTRFEPGETTNDVTLAGEFAALADVFVNDAFGAAHRAHASNVGVAGMLPSAAGRLLMNELEAFSRLIEADLHPYVVVIGGAKISDKLRVIERLLPNVDLMLIGGGMCFTLLEAAGYTVGNSLVEPEMRDKVHELLNGPHGDRIVLPNDIVVADGFRADAPAKVVPVSGIPDNWIGLDIGPATVGRFGEALRGAEEVFWNGPMGVFEWEAFRSGTAGVAEAVAAAPGYTVVGGGDSVAAIRMLGFETDVSHVSSGGGAGLSMLEGEPLPGVEVLRRNVQ